MSSSDVQRQQQQNVLFGNEYVSSELMAEFQQLQRRLNIMEADKRMQALEAADVDRRQRADLRRLEAENVELRGNLTAARSRSAQRERDWETRRLKELASELDSLEAEVKRTREAHLQLDANIRDARAGLKRSRLAGGPTGKAAGAEHSLHEALVLHERKLESRCVKYQTVVWQNAQLRESLDNLRVDRQKFLTVRERLTAQLERLHSRRAELTASATEAYRESEDARRRSKELEEREKAAVAEHTQRVKLLNREIDHHDDIGGFVRAKWRTRSPDPELHRLREDLELRRLEDRQKHESMEESLRRSFDLMRARYGAADLDAMVRHFLRREDENFSLFRYCTARQTEAAALSGEVDQLAASIRRAGLDEGLEAAGRSELLSELAGRLADVKADRLFRAERQRALVGVLDALAAGVIRIGGRIGAVGMADGVGVGAQDDGEAEVAKSRRRNLLRMLGCVEARVFDLLAVRRYLLETRERPDERQQQPPPPPAGRGSVAGLSRRRGTRRGTDAFAGLHLPEVDESDVEVRTAADRAQAEKPLTKAQIVERLQNEISM